MPLVCSLFRLKDQWLLPTLSETSPGYYVEGLPLREFDLNNLEGMRDLLYQERWKDLETRQVEIRTSGHVGFLDNLHLGKNAYHWFLEKRLSRLIALLKANGQPVVQQDVKSLEDFFILIQSHHYKF